MKTNLLFLITLSFVLSACGNPLGGGSGSGGSTVDPNFHPGVPSAPVAPPVPPVVALPFGAFGGVKLAPGAVAAEGSSLAASVAVTITNRRAVGTSISGRFSIAKFQAR